MELVFNALGKTNSFRIRNAHAYIIFAQIWTEHKTGQHFDSICTP